MLEQAEGMIVDIRKKILLVGVGMAVLSAAIATQYATISMGYEFGVVHPSEGFIRFVASDNAMDGHRLLRIVDNATGKMVLKFGDIPKGMNKTYTAAFAIVNEESFPVNITGVSVNGSGASYVRIWLHADATKDATSDTNVLLWNGAAVSGYWVLAAGNNDTTNMNGAATNTPWDTDDNVRYASSTPVATSGSTDFVWVQISIDTRGASMGDYNDGYIEFHFTSEV